MEILDLTQPLINFPYPGDPGLKISEKEAGGFIISEISMGSHICTHVDYPRHVNLENNIPFKDLIIKGNSYCIDLNDFEINKIPECDILLIYTGFSKYWGKEEYFEKIPKIQFLDEIVESNIKCLGVDACTIGGFEEHKKLLSKNILIIENLNENLKNLIGKRFYFLGLPLKIFDIDASPIRCIAIP
ncbi:cyclase family protein [Methanocaldococcus fervens]|uniref:Cyclase family protein n=1 Tax=Methanocaldococcus fervens (strain DSM 4213 / JCM 15782 / AG86) TaxID=573064 RepID=C7P8F7_METFA|nr:cyclase family protein [Methanocaldococcus fervens]ACV24839.1 cyclase family protein [Methanocaldococcus fervens AG86]